MPTIALIQDLLFRAKLEAAASRLGAALTMAPDQAAAIEAARRSDTPTVVVDLNHGAHDALDMVRAVRQASPSARIIGYCSHVETDLRQRAAEAGCTEVVPRSAFVMRMEEWLT
jgi:ActR/RegA family two-component response regulator